MSKIAVVYWSGTGNTAAMAEAVLDGAKDKGAAVSLFTSAEFRASMMDSFDALAFGCPSMGAEELEEGEFAPMFDACEARISGKRIGLFGSYGWGDGEWMRAWRERCESSGAIIVSEPVICNEAPDEAAIRDCRMLGAALI